MEVTLYLAEVSADDRTYGHTTVDEYRANGGGSGRTKWSRMAELMSAIATVYRTGKCVEVTDLFPMTDRVHGQDRPVRTGVYNIAHRALSSTLIRPDWHNVTIVCLENPVYRKVRGGGVMVTGRKTTDGRNRADKTVHTFVTPVE